MLISFAALESRAQTFEWRLVYGDYSNADPDGAGPAIGQVNFKFQIHTTGASVPNITQISTGFSYQSSRAMVPATTGCVLSISTPGNVVLSPAFAAAGFAYTSVQQCNNLSPAINSGSQSFDRRANGTLDNGSITIGAAWVDVYTVTLWTLQTSSPQGGYAVINSSEGGAPGQYTTYSVSTYNPATGDVNQYPANSLTYTNPLILSASGAPLPVLLTNFDAQCQPNKYTNLTWTTAQEINSSYFELEKSFDGSNWTTLAKLAGAGSSNSLKSYQLTDPQGGTAQYRLKQVDRDGKATYSTVVKTTCEGRNVYVSLYPVPARDLVNLVIGSDKNIKTALQVYDTKGKTVVSMAVTITQGVNNFKIPVQNLAAGEYFIKGTNGELEISKRFTIVR